MFRRAQHLRKDQPPVTYTLALTTKEKCLAASLETSPIGYGDGIHTTGHLTWFLPGMEKNFSVLPVYKTSITTET